jgi:dolichyl-phosphate beta-glucosyltransferase
LPISLSIVIPAYNERERLPPTLARILSYLGDRGLSAEILVCDDGSTDGTAEVAGRLLQAQDGIPWQVLATPANEGKGAAVRRGVLAAGGELILFSDADLSTPIEEFEKLAAAVESGAKVAIGSRGRPDSEVEVSQPIHREMMGRIFNLIVRTVLVPGICDTQCGFKLFRRDAARSLFKRAKANGLAFDVEILLLARRAGYRIAEVPVRWIDSPDSRVTLVGGSLSMLLDLARIRLRNP